MGAEAEESSVAAFVWFVVDKASDESPGTGDRPAERR